MKRDFFLLILFIFVICFSYAKHSEKGYFLVINNNSTVSNSNLEKYLIKRKINYIMADKNSDIQSILKNKIIGLILSGGPLLYSKKDINLEDISPNFAVLFNLDCPVLGICFGHQTLVKAFGGSTYKMPELVKRDEKIKILKQIELFDGLPNEVEMSQSHYDCTQIVPEQFEIVATSDSCKVEAIKHKTKPIFGVQFHPENSGEEGYKLLDNFVKFCININN